MANYNRVKIINGFPHKKCNGCEEIKPTEDFYCYNNSPMSKCKICQNAKSLKYYTDDKERRKKYKRDNWEKISKKNAKYHAKHRERRDWYYNKGGRERTLEYQKEYHKIPEVKAARSYRQSLRGVLNRIGTKKEKHTIEYLGYSASDYKEHIESLWKPGMSWENHGQGKGTWQVDHIKEIIHYVEEGITDTKIIHALDNLQPLWDDEHSKKSGEFLHQRKLNSINNNRS